MKISTIAGAVAISILCSHADCFSCHQQAAEFNLMQSTRAASVRVLLLLGIVISILCSPHGLLHLYDDISHAVIISILCSHSDYVIVPVSNISLAFSSCFVFFVCTNYLTSRICNQPCIVFIYTLYIILSYIPSHEQPQRNTKKYCFL